MRSKNTSNKSLNNNNISKLLSQRILQRDLVFAIGIHPKIANNKVRIIII